MSERQKVINGQQFVKILLSGKGRISTAHKPIIVSDSHLNIDGSHNEEFKTIEHLTIEGVSFLGMVTLSNLELKSLFIHSANLFGGLCLEEIESTRVSLGDISAETVHFWRVTANAAYIGGADIQKTLDISGLELKEHLEMPDTTFGKLELVHRAAGYTFKGPLVRLVNNPAAIRQFERARIPMYGVTEAAVNELAHA